ncbi:MAG: hypothetical protein QM632_06620 [Micrococcaceae bacterium]
MKRLSIPSWLVGAALMLGAILLAMYSNSTVQEISRNNNNRSIGSVRFDLISNAAITAALLIVTFILMFMARKHTAKGIAMRIVYLAAAVGLFLATLNNLPDISNTKIPGIFHLFSIIGSGFLVFSAVSIFFPSKREREKIAAQKEAQKEIKRQRKAAEADSEQVTSN